MFVDNQQNTSVHEFGLGYLTEDHRFSEIHPNFQRFLQSKSKLVGSTVVKNTNTPSKKIVIIEAAVAFSCLGFPSQPYQDGWRFNWGHHQIIIVRHHQIIIVGLTPPRIASVRGLIDTCSTGPASLLLAYVLLVD
jgi:hypothetical protein